MRKRLPKSIRKFIRKEKARIRREILDLKIQEEKIKKLYEKFFENFNKVNNKNKNKNQKDENKRNF